MVFSDFIPFYEDEYRSKLKKLSDRALKGACRQLKARMASTAARADADAVTAREASLAVHRRQINVRDHKLDMIKDELHRRSLSVPSMHLRDITPSSGRGMATDGFEAFGGFRDTVDKMQPDDYDNDYYDANYYGEDDYYDDYYDDGDYYTHDYDSSHSAPRSEDICLHPAR